MYSKNTLIKTANNSVQVHIVDVDPYMQNVAFYDLNWPGQKRKERTTKPKRPRYNRITRKPNVLSFEKFDELLKNKEIEILRATFDDGLYVPEHKHPLDKKRIINEREAKKDDRYSLIKDIVEDPNNRYTYLYTNRSRDIIRDISNKTGSTTGSITRLLSEYFQRGGTPSAMLPRYRFCGTNYSPIKEIIEGTKRRGPFSPEKPYRNTLESDIEKIALLLKKIGSRRFKAIGYIGSYHIYDYLFQSETRERTNDKGEIYEYRQAHPTQDCINYEQFYNQARKKIEDPNYHWNLKQDKVFLAPYDSRFKRARDGLAGPSFRFEIDATVEDIYITFPYYTKRKLSSGRPVVYKVIDVYSTLVVGLHVSLDGPNWRGASQALFNAFTCKVAFCKRYGVDIDYEDWPADVTCNHLTIDNGVEYPKQKMLDLVTEATGIEVINYTAIYSGESKGTVESDFNPFKNDVVKFLPGYVQRVPERGARHASNFSLIDYDQFVRLLILSTIKNNNYKAKVHIHDKAASRAGIPPTAREMWKFGMNHYMNNGKYKRFPQEDLLYALLPSGKASTTKYGLQFKGLFYSCDFAYSQGWLSDNNKRAVKNLDIRYCDESTNSIWYRWEGKYYTATLNTYSEIYKNVTWYDALHRMEFYRIETIALDAEMREQRLNEIHEMELTKKAAKESQAKLKKSNIKSASNQLSMTKKVQQAIQDKNASELYGHIMSQQINLSDISEKPKTQVITNDNNYNDMYGEAS